MSVGVVIGHGRSPEGKGWGKRIDRCDVVVRMWNCEWQDPVDYGLQYDYGLIEASPSIMRTFYQHNKRQPSDGWVASEMHGAKYCTLPPRTETVNQWRWNEIGRRLGGRGATGLLQFTRGTIAACWLIERASYGDTIILVGFDDVCRGYTAEPEESFAPGSLTSAGSFTTRGYKSGLTKFGNHDYPCERRVLESLASKKGVRLAFAQELWGHPGEDEPERHAGPEALNGAPKIDAAMSADRAGVVLLLGDAACVHDDIEAALKLFTPAKVAAVNCIGIEWPGQLDYWFTLHPDAVGPWPGIRIGLRRREKSGRNRPETWAHKIATGIDHSTADWGGASGLFGIKCLRLIGHERIVCAGIPMVASEGHYYDRTPWKWAERARKAWLRHKRDIAPYVRSMSGWTRETFGEPTAEWLASTPLSGAEHQGDALVRQESMT